MSRFVHSDVAVGGRPTLPGRRSEPSSRITLIGEQPNASELLHPGAVMSRPLIPLLLMA